MRLEIYVYLFIVHTKCPGDFLTVLKISKYLFNEKATWQLPKFAHGDIILSPTGHVFTLSPISLSLNCMVHLIFSRPSSWQRDLEIPVLNSKYVIQTAKHSSEELKPSIKVSLLPCHCLPIPSFKYMITHTGT